VGGGREMGTPRGRGRGVGRPREIKCDKCGKGFPSNVDESVLVHHIKTFHMTQPKQWACTKCDKVLGSEVALKYHTCSDVKFKCQDCNKLFMQKSTLMEHMAVSHGPRDPIEKSPEKPEIRKVLEQDWDEEEEEENADDIKTQNGAANEESKEEEPAKTIVMNAKVVEDSADEQGEVSKVLSESVPKEDEDDDEDKIVADIDDILGDTDRLVGNMKEIVDDKRKTSVIRKRNDFARGPAEVKDSSSPASKAAKLSSPKAAATPPKTQISMKQCETCYECFETEEKLAWHDLHVHAPPAIKPDDKLEDEL